MSRITQDKIRLEFQLVDLTQTIRDSVESVRTLARECDIHIEVTIPQQSLWVEGDFTRLEQIVANLLTNAIKYSTPGETVNLAAHRQQDRVVMRVEDSGVGIASEQLESIFDVFVQSDETLDRSHGGMGVGLTLVKKLVEMHGGTVVASSPEGEGAAPSKFPCRWRNRPSDDPTSRTITRP